MATLLYIRPSKDKTLLLLGISVEGESRRYGVTPELYERIGAPAVKEEIDEFALPEILLADEEYRAERKALSLLSYSDNNRRTLTAKLRRAGFSRDVAEGVCEKMVKLGYIDESRQLERIILSEANAKLRGPRKIIPALTAKGYSSFDVRAAMEALISSGEVDFASNAEILCEKKLPPDATEEERRALLYKNGYKI